MAGLAQAAAPLAQAGAEEHRCHSRLAAALGLLEALRGGRCVQHQQVPWQQHSSSMLHVFGCLMYLLACTVIEQVYLLACTVIEQVYLACTVRAKSRVATGRCQFHHDVCWSRRPEATCLTLSIKPALTDNC